jgi:hypothetical protein
VFIEKAVRKIYRLNLNENEDLKTYNEILQDPACTIVNQEIMPQTESHFEKDYSTTTTNHIAYLEVEECSF